MVMIVPPLIQQNARRDRFLSIVSTSRQVFGVQGEEGLARRPSRQFRDREVSLFWSHEGMAAGLAANIATHPRTKAFTLGDLLASILPGLSHHRRLVGLDWDGGDTVVELDPKDFAERLRLASLDVFVRAVERSGSVFTLEGPFGPALLRSQINPEGLVLPCWAVPGEAYARLEGPWRDMLVIETPLAAFISERLAWLSHTRHLVGPDYNEGPGALEMQPADLIACFGRSAA
jgi:hypothetical protein